MVRLYLYKIPRVARFIETVNGMTVFRGCEVSGLVLWLHAAQR